MRSLNSSQGLQAARRAIGAAALVLTAVVAHAESGASPTLQRIRDAGLISIGYRETSVPFSYLDARRQPIGYSIDICHRIVEAVRERVAEQPLEVREVKVSSATRLPMLASGAIDLECGVTTHTVDRDRMAAFSVTTFVAASRLMVKKDSPVQTLADLRGRSVVTTLATTSMQFLTAANRDLALEMTILAGSDDGDAIRLLRNDQAVAFAMDDVLLRGQIAAAPDGADYRVCEEALTVEPYAIGLPHGDPVFKALVDDVIVGLYRSGEMLALYRKWFQSPIPPHGVNLRMPTGDWLARQVRHPSDSAEPQQYR